MSRRPYRSAKRAHDLDFIGDHLAIDFVNTVRMVAGAVTDTLQADEDVKVWLGLAGVPVAVKPAPWRRGALLDAARRLRAATLKSIEARKEGKRPSLAEINAFLVLSTSHGALVPGDSSPEFRRIYHGSTPEGYLGPLAEAVADLLANGDFELIRRCESGSCVLWFYDRTRHHCRKYCTSAGCGNRAKVAAFRARLREQSED
ncbi:CGNR zinc finger domain-containing protein [Singulisphaera sp. PoT]|uniref:CGNR zinc finger domain-containing protein n=1 Tax=Singulisphaera sp. PoT TaxID=3411797 RepID=UPI003BF53927